MTLNMLLDFPELDFPSVNENTIVESFDVRIASTGFNIVSGT